MPHPSSLAKLALEGLRHVGGGDTHVLVAFRNNERQSRDQYVRVAAAANDDTATGATAPCSRSA